MKYNSLFDLYLHELRDLFSAENQLLKAIPLMAEAATSPKLKHALTSHLKETANQVTRLEKIFISLDESPKGTTCDAMKGLIKEGSTWIHEKALESVMDAGIIACAQRIEHYEIAGYGAARAFAEVLDRSEDVRLLDQTLQEEGAADKKLNALANEINKAAMLPTEV